MTSSRRKLLKSALIGGGLIGLGSLALPSLARNNSVQVPPLPQVPSAKNSFNPLFLLRDFDYGE